jgi:hypothetical protein
MCREEMGAAVATFVLLALDPCGRSGSDSRRLQHIEYNWMT